MAQANKDEVEAGIAILDAKLARIRDDVIDIKAMMRADHVRRDEFTPVQQIVFGLVAVFLLAVIGAMLSLVLQRQ